MTDGSIPTPGRRARLRQVGHVLGLVLLLAVVVPMLLYLVPQLVGAEYSYVVLSASMEPTLNPGDVVLVDAVEASAVETGDVINYRQGSDSRTTTHRVIEVLERDGEPTFRTQGDNNEDPDQGVVEPGELRGRVMTVGGAYLAIPLVGYLVQFASTQTGFALLFVIPLVLLVLNEAWTVLTRNGPPGDDVEANGGDGEAASGDGPPADEPAGSPDGLTFAPGELRLGLAILAAFVAYSAWIATTEPGPLTIGVAGSAIAALVLLGGLYTVGSPVVGTPVSTPASAESHGIAVGTATPPSGGSRERVSSLEALVDLAATTEGDLVRDPEAGVCYVAAGGTVYVYDAEPEASAPAVDDDPGTGEE